jgi:hypothetical protein
MWLLGTASGTAEQVEALHRSRLHMMLDKTTDTTVRGVVYEAAGTVGADSTAAGVEEVRRARRTNEIPFALIEADPRDIEAWVPAAHAAIDGLIAALVAR